MNLQYSKVAEKSERDAEDTSQAAPRAIVHAHMPGDSHTMCCQFLRNSCTPVEINRVVSCSECIAEVRKKAEHLKRDTEITEAKQRQVERDAEAMRKLRECCGFVENGSEQTVRIFQDDATRGWIVKCGDERLISSVPEKYSKPRSYHASSLNEAIDAAYIVEKQEF